jgi:hypothetical protein
LDRSTEGRHGCRGCSRERRFLADWLVSLVPLAGLVSADLDAALRRLAFLQIQA